ncbi:hypothetical protein EDB81DRAFT_859538 [Dactylonectria macrodidyma]|uniref:Uncharacterized protein n=1 Tax=Dactylonectria macrodidyma TaxID=307937 RepID=A0A9P9E9B7_9HYPO|nr:hypothetical protein EDB81DRAFT_859538 [Dactylonectria macrodidyma]
MMHRPASSRFRPRSRCRSRSLTDGMYMTNSCRVGRRVVGKLFHTSALRKVIELSFFLSFPLFIWFCHSSFHFAMTLGEPQMPPFTSHIPPVRPGWTGPDQRFPTPPRTYLEHTRASLHHHSSNTHSSNTHSGHTYLGVQQGLQDFFKEHGQRLRKAIAATVMDEIKGPCLDTFNRELGSLRTLMEEAFSQWQLTGNVTLVEAIEKMVRETQSSVEVLRALHGSRKGSNTRPVSRTSGIAKTRKKSRSGRRASQGPAQGAAGAVSQRVGQGIDQKALPCTALPERQRKRSPKDVKDTDGNSLPKAPRVSKGPSLPPSVADEELGRIRC